MNKLPGFNRVAGLAIAVSLGCLLGLLPVVLVAVFSVQAPRAEVSQELPLSQAFSVIPTHQPPSAKEAQPITIIRPTKLVFVGDIMLDRKVAERIQASKQEDYVFEKLPKNWFKSFDFAVANLEGPVTDQRRPPVKSIDFKFDPSVIPSLQRSGIDAFSQANNHALDQGSVGYADSVRRLRQAGFLVFGHEVEDNEISMATTTINGTSFAFLGFNTTDNPLNKVDAERVLKIATQSASHTIVFMHWGIEYKNHPTPEMQDLAHWFIDHGVSAVIGGHPHWYQGIESYKNHPIIYSLGNFVFDQDFSTQVQQGLAIVLTFDNDKIAIEPIPVEINQSQPHLVEEEEKTKRLKELADISDASLKTAIEQGSIEF